MQIIENILKDFYELGKSFGEYDQKLSEMHKEIMASYYEEKKDIYKDQILSTLKLFNFNGLKNFKELVDSNYAVGIVIGMNKIPVIEDTEEGGRIYFDEDDLIRLNKSFCLNLKKYE